MFQRWPERVLQLAVPVAPEHVHQRLPNRGSRRHRLREDCLGISDAKGQLDSRAGLRKPEPCDTSAPDNAAVIRKAARYAWRAADYSV